MVCIPDLHLVCSCSLRLFPSSMSAEMQVATEGMQAFDVIDLDVDATSTTTMHGTTTTSIANDTEQRSSSPHCVTYSRLTASPVRAMCRCMSSGTA